MARFQFPGMFFHNNMHRNISRMLFKLTGLCFYNGVNGFAGTGHTAVPDYYSAFHEYVHAMPRPSPSHQC